MGPLDSSMPAASAKPRNRKRAALIAGVLIAALIPVVQSTFAANITINNDSDIEFGQGVNLVAACDPSITLTPTSAFNNGSNSFYLDHITLEHSGSGATLGDRCYDKTFTVIARDTSNVLETFTFTLTKTVTYGPDVTTYGVTLPLSSPINAATNDGTVVDLDVSTANVSSSAIEKFTIETN